jgi:hypothetical protein
MTINNTVSVMAGVFIMGSLLLSGMSFSEPNWLWLSFFVGFNLFQSVEKGTTPEQKVHTTTLTKLPDLVASETIHAPTLIIVGEVVKLREKLNWFDA